MRCSVDRGAKPCRLAVVGMLAALVVAVGLSTHVNARLIASDYGFGAARVASFDISLDDGDATSVVDLSGIDKPGDSRTYAFSVSGESNVSSLYKVGLVVDGSMPLECSVTKDGAQVVGTTVGDMEDAVSAGAMPLVKTTDASYAFAPNDGGADAYLLTVMWPVSENDPEYSNGTVGEVAVRVVAEQVD